jgi:hypothetical protein
MPCTVTVSVHVGANHALHGDGFAEGCRFLAGCEQFIVGGSTRAVLQGDPVLAHDVFINLDYSGAQADRPFAQRGGVGLDFGDGQAAFELFKLTCRRCGDASGLRDRRRRTMAFLYLLVQFFQVTPCNRDTLYEPDGFKRPVQRLTVEVLHFHAAGNFDLVACGYFQRTGGDPSIALFKPQVGVAPGSDGFGDSALLGPGLSKYCRWCEKRQDARN